MLEVTLIEFGFTPFFFIFSTSDRNTEAPSQVAQSCHLQNICQDLSQERHGTFEKSHEKAR